MNEKVKKRIAEELKKKSGKLALRYCDLPSIPEVIKEMQWLTNLDLSGNQISKLEGLDGLSNLTVLYLSDNQISKLEGLDGLSNLTVLDLSGNQISKLEGLDGLSSLIILDLGTNPLDFIDKECRSLIGQIPSINFQGTKIKDLSFLSEEDLQNVEVLWEDISFRYGPAPKRVGYVEFERERGIVYHIKKGINLKDCIELDPGLIAAVKNGQKAFLTYLKEPKAFLYEARVLVLGEPRAGKTTLRRKLLDVGAPMPTDQESTKAFEIEVEPYNCEVEINARKENLRYYLWDFGGQDYYRLLHQLFVTEQSVYIIVVDTDRNKNEEEIAFWLDTIDRLGKDEKNQYGPVIVFQNPKNTRPGSSFTDLKKRYAFWQQPDDFVINLNALDKAKTETYRKEELSKFREFKKYLGKRFCQLEHVGKEIPKKWISVREALLEEKENWVTIERFNKICMDNQITQPEERANLLNIFRQLGYLLHYKDTALKGMVILNREWVTDALYRVLDDKIVTENKGWFSKNDAKKIWHEDKYKNRSTELLALMEEFKLCYQNPITKKYIVPSKLPSTNAHLPQWNTEDNVHLRLQYDWIPKALGIQLIVSLHEYIVTSEGGEQWIWRKGAVLDGTQLDLDGVQVRIQDDYPNNRISIEGRGKHTETLFRIILKKWKEVNEPFKDKVNVDPEILCPCKFRDKCKVLQTFRYKNVLKASEGNKELQCHESLELFKADDLLKGVYDETTVKLDAIRRKENQRVTELDLIGQDRLADAIALITDKKANTRFNRRLNELEGHKIAGVLSFEKKSQIKNALANDLINYFMIPYKMDAIKPKGEFLNLDRDELGIEDSFEDVLEKDAKQPPIQVIVNNSITRDEQANQPQKVTTDPSLKSKVVQKKFYEHWWFSRLVVAVIVGAILGYFGSKYFKLHVMDTWLGTSTLISIVLLWRNPNRAYLRWAGYCVMALSSLNILSQIDVAFNIIDKTEEERPWAFLFKLGFGEEPFISGILGVLAMGLFILDFRMRKDNP